MRGGEFPQAGQHGHQPIADQRETFAHQQQVGVVGHVTAGGAEMDDRTSVWAAIAERMHVGHDIVPQFAFVALGGRKVDVIDRGPHLRNLRLTDIEPQFRFGLGQRYPQSAPSTELALIAPEFRHGGGGIAGDQRVFVAVVSLAHRCFVVPSDV